MQFRCQNIRFWGFWVVLWGLIWMKNKLRPLLWRHMSIWWCHKIRNVHTGVGMQCWCQMYVFEASKSFCYVQFNEEISHAHFYTQKIYILHDVTGNTNNWDVKIGVGKQFWCENIVFLWFWVVLWCLIWRENKPHPFFHTNYPTNCAKKIPYMGFTNLSCHLHTSN